MDLQGFSSKPSDEPENVSFTEIEDTPVTPIAQRDPQNAFPLPPVSNAVNFSKIFSSTPKQRFEHLFDNPGDFISPSKEGEVSMEMSPATPARTRPPCTPKASNRKSIKDILANNLSPDDRPENKTTPVSSGRLFLRQTEDLNLLSGSEKSTEENFHGKKTPKFLQALANQDKYELSPQDIFSKTASASSSGQNAQDLIDAIDVNLPNTESAAIKQEDFLKRTTKGIRRCRSLELRKHFNDMSNTPPSSLRRGPFKRPIERDIHSRAKRDCKISLGILEESRSDELDYAIPGSRINDDLNCMRESCSEGAAMSDQQDRIKLAVDALQSSDLVADGSRSYSLPVIQGKHSDLKNIHHDTMKDILCNKYSSCYDKLTIIDCRYPYEFSGGHITGAVNMYSEESMQEFLKHESAERQVTPCIHILVFHCEFSSQRAPGLSRFLRKADRQLNSHLYPSLTFPEIYCLFGGYKDFFMNHPTFCEPSNYIPMADEQFSQQLRHFRSKAKSWAAGEKFKLLQQS